MTLHLPDRNALLLIASISGACIFAAVAVYWIWG